MGRAVLQGGRSADIHEICFQTANRSDKDWVEVQGVQFLIVRNGIYRLRNVQKRAVLSCKMVDLLMLRNRVFRMRIVQKCSVPSHKRVDLLMLRNRVFRLRNAQKCAMRSWKDFDFLVLRNWVLRFGNVHICVVPPGMWSICWFSGIAFSGIETLKYV